MAVEGMEELGRKLRELAQTNLTQATAQAIEIVRSAAVLIAMKTPENLDRASTQK